MTQFSIMTFNIRGAFFEDNTNVWEARRDLNVQTVKKYDADLMGFQECQSANQAVYAQEFTDHDFELGLRSLNDNELYHNTPIYWRRSMFEKLDHGQFYMSETPEKWSKGWGATYVRAAHWCKFRIKDSGTEFVHLNTHFSSSSEEARLNGARMIIEAINEIRRETPLPAIVTADFNSRAYDTWEDGKPPRDTMPEVFRGSNWFPANTVHRVFKEAGFKDAYLEAGNEEVSDTNTFHGFYGRNFTPIGLRIDWILLLDGAQKFEVESCEIVRDEAPPLYPSDHYPIFARLNLA